MSQNASGLSNMMAAANGNETAPGRPRLARRPQRRRCGSGFYVLGGRDIARIDWGGEEGLRIERPELADVGVGLHHRIYQLAILALDLADEHGHDRIAVLVDFPIAAGIVHRAGIAQCLHERFLVLDLAVHRLGGRLDQHAGGIRAQRVVARIDAVLLVHRGDEAFVVRGVDAGGVPAAGGHADRLVAHLLQDALIGGGHGAQPRPLHAVLLVLLEEAQAVGPGEAGVDRLGVLLQLTDVGAVVGYIQWRAQLLHHFAAVVLEYALESRHGFVAVGEIVGDDGDALVAERLRSVPAERMIWLRRTADRAHEPRVDLALREVLGRGGVG